MPAVLLIVGAVLLLSLMGQGQSGPDSQQEAGQDTEAPTSDQDATPIPDATDTSSNDATGLATGTEDGYSVNSKVTQTLPANVQALITQTANQYGVDPDLAMAVAYTESRGNQNAVSPVGALGVFQLMPTTAAGLGVDPNSLEGNIEGGVKYLSQMLSRFNGDTTNALAAYNAGPGKVSKYGGVPPFAETQTYVQRILALLEG